MAVSPPPAPSSIDLSGLPPRVVEAAARVLALCREELRSEPRPEAPEEAELRVREATNEFARDVWTHAPGPIAPLYLRKVEAPYTVCIASASNLTGLVKSSVECRRTGL